jgi:hypothetical protein
MDIRNIQISLSKDDVVIRCRHRDGSFPSLIYITQLDVNSSLCDDAKSWRNQRLEEGYRVRYENTGITEWYEDTIAYRHQDENTPNVGEPFSVGDVEYLNPTPEGKIKEQETKPDQQWYQIKHNRLHLTQNRNGKLTEKFLGEIYKNPTFLNGMDRLFLDSIMKLNEKSLIEYIGQINETK